MKNMMQTAENLTFENEVYSKLQMAESEAERTSQRYSSKEVLDSLKNIITGKYEDLL